MASTKFSNSISGAAQSSAISSDISSPQPRLQKRSSWTSVDDFALVESPTSLRPAPSITDSASFSDSASRPNEDLNDAASNEDGEHGSRGHDNPRSDSNNLYGNHNSPAAFSRRVFADRTMFIFGSQNPVRVWCLRICSSEVVEILLLALLLADVAVLSVLNASSSFTTQVARIVRTVFFSIFTLEFLIKCIATGVIFESTSASMALHHSRSVTRTHTTHSLHTYPPRPYSTPDNQTENTTVGARFLTNLRSQSQSQSASKFESILQKTSDRAYNTSQSSASYPSQQQYQHQTSSTTNLLLANSQSALKPKEYPFSTSIYHQLSLIHHRRPHLRHSWARVDTIALLAFWLSAFLPQGSGAQLVCSALSVIRAFRLLTISHGTNTIILSLKRAGPYLVQVGLFISFATALFSIIGVQSFQGSFHRVCVYQGPDPFGQTNIVLEPLQFCGSYIDTQTNNTIAAVNLPGRTGVVKGHVCPRGQVCVTQESSPHLGVQSFDNVVLSTLQIVVIATANTWAPVMYYMMDSDNLAAAAFFLIVLIALNFWLFNLLVAVITSSFDAISEQSRKSAFGAGTINNHIDDISASTNTAVKDKGQYSPMAMFGKMSKMTSNPVAKLYGYTKYLWLVLILTSVILLGIQDINASLSTVRLCRRVEAAITILFDIEIFLRFLASTPNWRRNFFGKNGNIFDIILAVGSTITLVPAIRSSPSYPWLTAFILARFWRIIVALPRIKDLVAKVFSSLGGLVNMIAFLLLITYVGALFAGQLLRGRITIAGNSMNFGNIWNGFLAMYQILSSENWTDVLYTATNSTEGDVILTLVAAFFICSWILVGYFVMLQLFIAVINENFSFDEEQKRQQQVRRYVDTAAPISKAASVFERFNPYRHMKVPVKVNRDISEPVGNDAIANPFKRRADAQIAKANSQNHPVGLRQQSLSKIFHQLVRKYLRKPEQKASSTLNEPPGTPSMHDGALALHKHLNLLVLNTQQTAKEEHLDALKEQRAIEMQFIASHPTYDVSLFIFRQSNIIRQICQKLCRAPHGDRLFGIPPSPLFESIARLVMVIIVVASIVVAAVSSPPYRRAYYEKNGIFRGTWFDVTEGSLGLAFVIEFLIKVIADGFIFTPNGFVKDVWNVLDFFVLITIVVSTLSELVFIGGQNNVTRLLKAFRALRLITLSVTMRNTFYGVIIAGFASLFDASILAVLYMIPYAVWGQQIFQGRLFTCSDASVFGKVDCINEYQNSPSAWSFPMPRVWDNPGRATLSSSWSFDDFKSSLLILFEIVSLEGWIDVQDSVTQITSIDVQPQQGASAANAFFTVGYNLLGSVVILTLFVSTIIESFSARSGSAFLTNDQRQWINLKKLINRQRPAKRPKLPARRTFRRWCFDRAVKKHGWWNRAATLLYLVQVVTLMTQNFSEAPGSETIRNYIYLSLMTFNTIDIGVKLYGLRWHSFIDNTWHIFDVISVTGSFATTIAVMAGSSSQTVLQFQKLFLVSILLKLVQRSNSLNQLVKIAVSSLPAIMNLFLLWSAFFIVWGLLFMEIFGLTKWNYNETHNQNFNSFPRALLMMSFFSVGEGWNSYMHDYTIAWPRCTDSANYLQSDCGSTKAAFILFISWNVLSMYLLANMFTGVVVESFSYIFQRGGNVIGRDDMRDFKKVWTEFDVERTGFLARKDFVPFFGKLTGIFEVKIFPTAWSVPVLTNLARLQPGESYKGPVMEGIKVNELDRLIAQIDQGQVRRRRQLYERLYHESLIMDKGGGISFSDMLLLLAHYKLIDDDNALQLDELFKRHEIKKRVEVLVNLDRVRSVLKTLYYRHKYNDVISSKRENTREMTQTTMRMDTLDSAYSVPEIYVQEGNGRKTRPINGRDFIPTSPSDLAAELEALHQDPFRRSNDFELQMRPDSLLSDSDTDEYEHNAKQ